MHTPTYTGRVCVQPAWLSVGREIRWINYLTTKNVRGRRKDLFLKHISYFGFLISDRPAKTQLRYRMARLDSVERRLTWRGPFIHLSLIIIVIYQYDLS